MPHWNFSPPPPSELGDHDVILLGNHLKNKRIALLITGSIAAIKTPFIARCLRQYGAEVVAYISKEGLRYVTEESLIWSTTNPVITRLSADSEHLSDSQPFDAYLVAPATYNTINKLAHGIADNVVTTTLASALGRMEQGKTKILIAPTMHGSLHNSILTKSLNTLNDLGISIIPPREAYGKHNIPDEKTVVSEVCRAVSTSPLKNLPILVTGGPIPAPIDGVRQLTNRFTGKLSVDILEELYLRGADVLLIQGVGRYFPDNHLPFIVAKTYNDYYQCVMETLEKKSYKVGIFSAAVADFALETPLSGKTPSDNPLNLKLIPTIKVIEQVKKRFSELHMVIFKYQENISHESLMDIAHRRLNQGYSAIVANRGEEMPENGEHIAHLVSDIGQSLKLIGKKNIAIGIADYLEKVFPS
jgi:phosphopantothenoylcysteine decarboxylase/phosphopantothenate--cysteine ligase